MYVALLRAINVAGHGKAAMAGLRAMLDGLGFDSPRSLLQTGNLVFRSQDQPASGLEELLEAEAARHLSLRTDVIVRTADETGRVVARNPFPDEARDNPSHLLVMFLKKAPDASAVERLRAAVKGVEQVRVEESEAYVTYPAGVGRSPVTNALIEAKLGVRGTGRNWNRPQAPGAREAVNRRRK